MTELKRSHYAHFDLQDLRSNINSFFANLTRFSADENLDRILNIVQVNDRLLFPFSWDEYPTGEKFVRARKMTREQLLAGITVPDLWEAPAKQTSPGRLNRLREPLLYACAAGPNGNGCDLGPLRETRLTAGDGFILIEYILEGPTSFKRIGISNPDPSLTLKEKLIEEELSKFVTNLMALPALEGSDDTYALTQRVLRSFFPLDSGWESGWIYESTVAAGVINATFETAPAHEKLRVGCVVAGMVQEHTEDQILYTIAGRSDGLARLGPHIRWEHYKSAHAPG